MSRPKVYRRNLARLGAGGHAPFCFRGVEPHVRYEARDKAYRVELRCACRAQEERLPDLYPTHAEADAASRRT